MKSLVFQGFALVYDLRSTSQEGIDYDDKDYVLTFFKRAGLIYKWFQVDAVDSRFRNYLALYFLFTIDCYLSRS